TNQLTAGLALAVIAVRVTRNQRNPAAILNPLLFLLGMTSWALIVNLGNFLAEGQWVLAPLDAFIFVLAIWLIVESGIALYRTWHSRSPGTGEPGEPERTSRSAPLESGPDSGHGKHA